MVRNVVPLHDRPLSPRGAMERIRLLWKEGRVWWVPHAEERLKQRGLDMLDVAHIIRYGRVTEHSRPASLWRYKIEGKSVDNAWAACVVEINGDLLIVTVIT